MELLHSANLWKSKNQWKMYSSLDIQCGFQWSHGSMDSRVSAGLYILYFYVYTYNRSTRSSIVLIGMYMLCREPAHRPKYCTVLQNITRHRHSLQNHPHDFKYIDPLQSIHVYALGLYSRYLFWVTIYIYIYGICPSVNVKYVQNWQGNLFVRLLKVFQKKVFHWRISIFLNARQITTQSVIIHFVTLIHIKLVLHWFYSNYNWWIFSRTKNDLALNVSFSFHDDIVHESLHIYTRLKSAELR